PQHPGPLPDRVPQDCGPKVPGDRTARLPGQREYVPRPGRVGCAIRAAHDREPPVHIDLASPRVSRTEGEALFREYGGSSDFLERMSSVLLTIHQGLEAMPAFIDALLQHDLLESFVLDVELNDRSQHRLTGFYTINEERLGTLDAGGLE